MKGAIDEHQARGFTNEAEHRVRKALVSRGSSDGGVKVAVVLKRREQTVGDKRGGHEIGAPPWPAASAHQDEAEKSFM